MESNISELIDTKNRLVVAKGRRWDLGNMVKVVKKYKLPVISSGDVMHNVVTIVNSTVLYI